MRVFLGKKKKNKLPAKKLFQKKEKLQYNTIPAIQVTYYSQHISNKFKTIKLYNNSIKAFQVCFFNESNLLHFDINISLLPRFGIGISAFSHNKDVFELHILFIGRQIRSLVKD